MLRVHQKVAAKSERAHARAPDRFISLHDTEMRHGRKSASKKFNGHKVSTICLANRIDQASELILDIEDLSVGLG